MQKSTHVAPVPFMASPHLLKNVKNWIDKYRDLGLDCGFCSKIRTNYTNFLLSSRSVFAFSSHFAAFIPCFFILSFHPNVVLFIHVIIPSKSSSHSRTRISCCFPWLPYLLAGKCYPVKKKWSCRSAGREWNFHLPSLLCFSVPSLFLCCNGANSKLVLPKFIKGRRPKAMSPHESRRSGSSVFRCLAFLLLFQYSFQLKPINSNPVGSKLLQITHYTDSTFHYKARSRSSGLVFKLFHN